MLYRDFSEIAVHSKVISEKNYLQTRQSIDLFVKQQQKKPDCISTIFKVLETIAINLNSLFVFLTL